jgi:hypothetical protein
MKLFKPQDFEWYVKKDSSVIGFTQELANFVNDTLDNGDHLAGQCIREMLTALEYIGGYNKALYDLYDEALELTRCQNKARYVLTILEEQNAINKRNK